MKIRARIDDVESEQTWERVYPAPPRAGDVLDLDGYRFTVEVVQWLDPTDRSRRFDIYIRAHL